MMSYPIRGFPLSSMTRPGWSEFGAPRPGSTTGVHNGFDYYCPEGTPIYATGPGEVTGKGTGTGPRSFGNYVRITYDGGGVATYAHMQAPSPLSKGKRVNADTQIGIVGHTGNASSIIWNGLRHVHEEIFLGGRYVNPIAFHGADTAGGGATPLPEQVKGNDMKVIKHPNGQHAFVGEFTFVQCAPSTATDMAAIWGPIVNVTDPQYLFQKQTAEQNRAALAAGSGFTAADRAVLNDVPTNGEMGQALTSTVSLVNQHADVNKDAIIAAIESAPAAAGGPLTVTLTGTAQPEG